MLNHPILHRREWLQAGACTLLGITLPKVFAGRAASAPAQADRRRARSVVLVLLSGGASQLDTLDMKPEAPAEIRGEFRPIATNVAGIQICEHLPRLAERMHHWALVRSFSHGENGHLPGIHRLLTGAPMPNQRITDLDNVLSRRDWPCYAAGLDRVRPRHDGVPNGVTLPHALIEGPLTWPGQHAGFLGAAHDPLLVTQNPNAPTFRMESFSLPADSSPERMVQRQRLLDNFAATSHPFRQQQQLAFEMLSSGRVAQAFRLEREPDRIRDRYGRTMLGQSLLLARRLVQAGVPVIQANMGIVQSWDTHVDNWGRLRNRLLPWLDQGLAALVDDLSAEGLLDDTLVVVMGEFGRTPRVSNLPGETLPGRDHWAAVYSGLFAGAGVRGGQVIGRSDRISAYPMSDPFTPYDVGATVYEALGVDPDAEIQDALGRRHRINQGKVIREIF
ncbi:MAG: DUF1501 domain-containing protein [Gemmataceae bacterium]|nr:DUF1501 domain-containing protein [Gemmataceae bacterium]MCI0741163.1 DUF1501 domain-containing protein [Gemmataceae bacterium]